jgi:hypothetical protein
MHEPAAPSTPFPTLMLDVDSVWVWPKPPFARNHIMTPLDGGAQPCCIETHNGTEVQGQLLHFDVDAGMLRVSLAADRGTVELPFTKFRRLTLVTPWPLASRGVDEPVERVPTAVQERSYRIVLLQGGELSGNTMGHVRDKAGLFLFTPLDDGAAVLRVFVPHAAFATVAFGKTAEEQAAERWISTPQQLFAALDAQKSAPIKPLGDALVDLGFMTRGAVERAVRDQPDDNERPLGEELVAAGLLDRADLKTALAHKMGYPLVDLAHFPIDPKAARRLSAKSMRDHHAVPLLEAGDRLIVAIDDLARVPRLQSLEALAGMQLVPVLASRAQIALALGALPQRLGTDPWADNVQIHVHALPTAPGELRSH